MDDVPETRGLIVFDTTALPEFSSPADRAGTYVKRLIGLPGETLTIREGRLYADDSPIDYVPLENPEAFRIGRYLTENSPSYTVPENSYFVLGDNLSMSADSRIWGPVSADGIRGRAFIRFWPIDRFGIPE